MNPPLPPLRTARDALQANPTPVRTSAPARPIVPGLDHPALPYPAKEMLAELVERGLLAAGSIPDFLHKVGTGVPKLATRDRTAETLAGLGYLTRYQVSRVISGQARGLVLGGYRVLDRIGSGSVGAVFLGEHPLLGRRVAVKVVAADETAKPEAAARFAAEVRNLARLSHPHIVAAYDAGSVPPEEPGQPTLWYVVMELVLGGDVEGFVGDKGPQPIGLGCEWGRQAASALRAAHAAGVVHRDVKPSNLLLTESRRVKLIDFGLARDFASTRTSPRTLVGSVEFMAPEQLADAPTAGPAADVYGLGATLFWVLTGHLPYPKAKSTADAVRAARAGPPRTPQEVGAKLPAELDALVVRMMARNPADRPTPGEVAAALTPFAAPSSHPALDDAPLIVDDETEAGLLRSAIQEIEDVTRAVAAQAAATRGAVLTALAAAAAARPGESPQHQQRVAGYVRALAAALKAEPDWAMLADPGYVDDLARAAAAHDLGLVGVPDEVLENLTRLTPSDRHLYEAHPEVGDQVLDALAKEHGAALPFLRVARAVVRHHHERWDGTGFPDKLAAGKIPPAARLVAVADAYDTLRRNQAGLAHADAVKRLARQSGSVLDPTVVAAFLTCDAEFDKLYEAIPDPDRPVLTQDDAEPDEGAPEQGDPGGEAE
jgi:HD-GYP domain-containing protein (c-di-GMP phosphodiesterase class II)